METRIKQKVRKFVKKYHLQAVTEEKLRDAVKQMGYTIVEYDDAGSDENVARLLSALELETFARHTRGFTYANSKMRLIFIHRDLSPEEKKIVLAHETGHICCDHFSSAPIIGRDVTEEYEASEFAHYLLLETPGTRLKHGMKKHRKALIAAAAALAVVIAGCCILGGVLSQQKYYGEYYITETGNRYHKKDCSFIRHKDNVSRLTREQYESGKYKPCEKCLPEEASEEK